MSDAESGAAGRGAGHSRWQLLRSASALICLVSAALPAAAAPPAQYSALHTSTIDGLDYSCAGCHGSPRPSLGSGIVPVGATAISGLDLRNKMIANGSMAVILNSNLNDTDLNVIRLYLKDVRDGAVSGTTTFGSSVANLAGSTRDFTIVNEREEDATFLTAPQGGNGEFAVVAGGTCTGATTLVAGGSCTVRMQFTPAAIGPRVGSLVFRLNNRLGLTSQQVSLALSGTGLDPAPVYATGNIGILTVPGFQAPTTGSQTLCPTIRNDAPTPGGFDLQISLSAAQSGGTDYTGYYQVAALASCPGGAIGLRCTSAAPGSAIGGTATIPAGGSCTLPITFNPSLLGFAGGTGARNAVLTIAHNAPAGGPSVSYNLQGIVSTSPRIGITTNPAISSGKVSPPQFASQVVATTSALWNDFLVMNIGTADGLDITAVSNSNPTEFTLTENCVAAAPMAQLAGGVPTCTIGLTFKPLAAPGGLGERCTTLSIQAIASGTGDPVNPEVVMVCGTGVPVPVPLMTVTPASVAFGNRSIGAIYLPEPIVVRNETGATLDLQIGAVALNGSGFAFVPDASSCQNKTLAAGTSCTVQVQFAPTIGSEGTSYSSSVTINSNDPVTPQRVVPLTATAVAYSVPALFWDGAPSTLVFSDLVIAGQQSTQTLTARLVSSGPGGVDLQSVRVVGSDAASFSITGCPTPLFEGQPCDISIRFLPGSAGVKTAQIEVVATGGVPPPLLSLQGQGVGGVSPNLVLSVNALVFDDVRVGASSQPVQVLLSASGGVVKVTGMTVDAPFGIERGSCPPVPFVLSLGSDCSIVVTFTPTSTAPVKSRLSIATDNGAAPYEVTLDASAEDQARGSSGGCSLIEAEDPRGDPTLWALVLAAIVLLWRRRRSRECTAHGERGSDQ